MIMWKFLTARNMTEGSLRQILYLIGRLVATIKNVFVCHTSTTFFTWYNDNLISI